MSAAPLPCDCPLSGFCERHQKFKGPTMHRLCQTRDDYRAKWDRDVGLLPPKPEAPDKPPRKPCPPKDSLACIYRGEQIGLVENCGCSHGEVPIFVCHHPEIPQREVLLRSVGKRPHTEPYQSYPVCRGCALQSRPDGKPSLLQGIESSTSGESTTSGSTSLVSDCHQAPSNQP